MWMKVAAATSAGPSGNLHIMDLDLSDGNKGTAMWTAVHDVTVHNGTLHVIAGMDREV